MDYYNLIQNKIFTKKEAAYQQLQVWRFKSQKLVFTNGVFDLIHQGHIEYLSKSASLGNKLIVGINTDVSVKKIKGTKRPINSEVGRATIIAACQFVDMVILFNENTPYNLIKYIKPQVLVKGGDYKIEDIVGNEVVKKNGGEVLTIPLTDGISSSIIIKKIQHINE